MKKEQLLLIFSLGSFVQPAFCSAPDYGDENFSNTYPSSTSLKKTIVEETAQRASKQLEEALGKIRNKSVVLSLRRSMRELPEQLQTPEAVKVIIPLRDYAENYIFLLKTLPKQLQTLETLEFIISAKSAAAKLVDIWKKLPKDLQTLQLLKETNIFTLKSLENIVSAWATLFADLKDPMILERLKALRYKTSMMLEVYNELPLDRQNRKTKAHLRSLRRKTSKLLDACTKLPQDFHTLETLKLLTTAGYSATEVVNTCTALPEELQTLETLKLLTTAGYNAKVIVNACTALPEELQTLEALKKISLLRSRHTWGFGDILLAHSKISSIKLRTLETLELLCINHAEAKAAVEAFNLMPEKEQTPKLLEKFIRSPKEREIAYSSIISSRSSGMSLKAVRELRPDELPDVSGILDKNVIAGFDSFAQPYLKKEPELTKTYNLGLLRVLNFFFTGSQDIAWKMYEGVYTTNREFFATSFKFILQRFQELGESDKSTNKTENTDYIYALLNTLIVGFTDCQSRQAMELTQVVESLRGIFFAPTRHSSSSVQGYIINMLNSFKTDTFSQMIKGVTDSHKRARIYQTVNEAVALNAFLFKETISFLSDDERRRIYFDYFAFFNLDAFLIRLNESFDNINDKGRRFCPYAVRADILKFLPNDKQDSYREMIFTLHDEFLGGNPFSPKITVEELHFLLYSMSIAASYTKATPEEILGKLIPIEQDETFEEENTILTSSARSSTQFIEFTSESLQKAATLAANPEIDETYLQILLSGMTELSQGDTGYKKQQELLRVLKDRVLYWIDNSRAKRAIESLTDWESYPLEERIDYLEKDFSKEVCDQLDCKVSR